MSRALIQRVEYIPFHAESEKYSLADGD